ncbi:MAG: NAD(P)-binding protein [Streptosporangiales bacterium]|nr:NAD(P)-binding protein [Streptosporangiales bacterium]
MEPQGGLSGDALARARQAAVDALVGVRDRGGFPAEVEHPPEQMQRLMAFLTGDAGAEYLPMLEHELGLLGDVGAPTWTKDDVAPDVDFSVAVIGAGMSGIAAAHRLDQAKVPFVVFEKNGDVGGTWLENNYPGCRLDTSNFAYSYSFAQKSDWPQQFSAQAEIRDYFKDVATTLQLRDRIRFRTEVLAAAYDDESATWQLRTRNSAGVEETLTVNAVISAVGQLNEPNYPDLPGMDRYAGVAMHSARWDTGVELAGKRVGVIGTGASAYQIIPSIAGEVDQLVVFQRNAPWMLPTPAYHADMSAGMRWLFQRVPDFHRWYRFWQVWIATEGRLPLVAVDPEWPGEESLSAANDLLRRQLVDELRRQYADRPDLFEKVLPTYPAGAKRMLRDNGVWAATLHEPHVDLVTESIAEVTEKGVRTADGVEHEVDVLVYATGFRASEFLTPMQVTGRGGVDLHEQWAGDARAYLGIAVPGFPNLFCVYGPNTNLVVTGSIIYMSECAVEYILECLRALLAGGHRAMDCRREPYEAYTEMIDARNRLQAWGAAEVSSWYKNANGRVTQNWPLPLLKYWQFTRELDLSAYELL